MIISHSLSDFQSHRASTLTFLNGVNVIIGSSEAGKSAIVRSLRWAIHNRPSGDEFISHWAQEARVRTVFSDGVVERIKSDKENCYILNDVKLVGFGQDIPDEISSLTNMNDLNIQYQFDGPFLLGESSGAVARTLNKVINLDKIDRSLSNVRKKESDVKNAMISIKTSIDNITKSLSASPNFKIIDRLMKQATQLEVDINKNKKVIGELNILQKDIAFCRRTLDNINVPNIDFTYLENSITMIKNKNEELGNLRKTLVEINKWKAEVQSHERDLDKWTNKLKSFGLKECPLCGQPIHPTSLIDANGVDNGVPPGNGGHYSVPSPATKNGVINSFLNQTDLPYPKRRRNGSV